MKRILFFLLLCLLPAKLFCQVIAAAGTSTTAGGINLNYTLGETFIRTNFSSPLTVTEGFHQPEYVRFHTRLFLQGFYIGNQTMSAVVDPQGHPEITDTIIVSLMHGETPYPLLWTKQLLIDTGGNIYSWLPPSLYGKYAWIKISHRNHIETWSKSPILLKSVAEYDFTKEP